MSLGRIVVQQWSVYLSSAVECLPVCYTLQCKVYRELCAHRRLNSEKCTRHIVNPVHLRLYTV